MDNSDYSIVPESLNPRTYSYIVAMDNYEPVRNEVVVNGGLIVYDEKNGGSAYVLEYPAHMTDDDAHHAGYILDFGHGKPPVITYVAGWATCIDEAYVYLRDFPTADDSAIRWHIGPRKTYHIRMLAGK